MSWSFFGLETVIAEVFSEAKPEKVTGWLNKQSRGQSVFSLTNWKKRHFVLDDAKLKYFEKEEFDIATATTLKGEIALIDMKVHETPDKFCSGKTGKLIALVKEAGIDDLQLLVESDSVEDAVRWTEAIRHHIRYYRDLRARLIEKEAADRAAALVEHIKYFLH